MLNNTHKPNLFIIEDNTMYALMIDALIAEKYHFNTFDFFSFENCMMFGEISPDIIILDYMLPGINGVQAIPRLKSKWPDAQIIVLSSQNDSAVAMQILGSNVCDYIHKSSTKGVELYNGIEKALAILGSNNKLN